MGTYGKYFKCYTFKLNILIFTYNLCILLYIGCNRFILRMQKLLFNILKFFKMVNTNLFQGLKTL